MADIRAALEMTRQRLAISRELISQSRRHLRSAAAQRVLDRTAWPRYGEPPSSSATPPA